MADAPSFAAPGRTDPHRADPASDAAYEAIRTALSESGRGRWFLDEHARRARTPEIDAMVAVVGRIEALLVQAGETPATAPLPEPVTEALERLAALADQPEALDRTDEVLDALARIEALTSAEPPVPVSLADAVARIELGLGELAQKKPEPAVPDAVTDALARIELGVGSLTEAPPPAPAVPEAVTDALARLELALNELVHKPEPGVPGVVTSALSRIERTVGRLADAPPPAPAVPAAVTDALARLELALGDLAQRPEPGVPDAVSSAFARIELTLANLGERREAPPPEWSDEIAGALVRVEAALAEERASPTLIGILADLSAALARIEGLLVRHREPEVVLAVPPEISAAVGRIETALAALRAPAGIAALEDHLRGDLAKLGRTMERLGGEVAALAASSLAAGSRDRRDGRDDTLAALLRAQNGRLEELIDVWGRVSAAPVAGAAAGVAAAAAMPATMPAAMPPQAVDSQVAAPDAAALADAPCARSIDLAEVAPEEPVFGEALAGEPLAGEPVPGMPLAGEPVPGEPVPDGAEAAFAAIAASAAAELADEPVVNSVVTEDIVTEDIVVEDIAVEDMAVEDMAVEDMAVASDTPPAPADAEDGALRAVAAALFGAPAEDASTAAALESSLGTPAAEADTIVATEVGATEVGETGTGETRLGETGLGKTETPVAASEPGEEATPADRDDAFEAAAAEPAAKTTVSAGSPAGAPDETPEAFAGQAEDEEKADADILSAARDETEEDDGEVADPSLSLPDLPEASEAIEASEQREPSAASYAIATPMLPAVDFDFAVPPSPAEDAPERAASPEEPAHMDVAEIDAAADESKDGQPRDESPRDESQGDESPGDESPGEHTILDDIADALRAVAERIDHPEPEPPAADDVSEPVDEPPSDLTEALAAIRKIMSEAPPAGLYRETSDDAAADPAYDAASLDEELFAEEPSEDVDDGFSTSAATDAAERQPETETASADAPPISAETNGAATNAAETDGAETNERETDDGETDAAPDGSLPSWLVGRAAEPVEIAAPDFFPAPRPAEPLAAEPASGRPAGLGPDWTPPEGDGADEATHEPPPPADPLAALDSLTEDERIALFS